jgi:hypothetical protein
MSKTPLDITPNESHAYHIGFHFLFLLMGYTVRGYRSANQMFLNFASLATSLITLIIITAGLRMIVMRRNSELQPVYADGTLYGPSGIDAIDIIWLTIWSALVIALVANIIMMQRLIGVVRRSPHLFPQHSHAMV